MTALPLAHDHEGVTLIDYEPALDHIREDVLNALAGNPRVLPPKYFYDEPGARLFERICELDAYYLTRTESCIHERNLREIARRIGPNARIVEFGSGSGMKTTRIIDACLTPAAYVPVDIARSQLVDLALSVSAAFSDVEVLPVCADYASRFSLPLPERDVARTVAFYHGSTIGNFLPRDAERFLLSVGQLCGSDSGLLIGVDLAKDTRIIERAYNDPEGITAAFNLNMLRRINRECGADFDLDAFRHRAFFDTRWSRVEMQLISERDQVVTIPLDADTGETRQFSFSQGDILTTEYSYKYEVHAFEQLAARAGWATEQFWTDERRWFGVWLLKRSSK